MGVAQHLINAIRIMDSRGRRLDDKSIALWEGEWDELRNEIFECLANAYYNDDEDKLKFVDPAPE